MRPFTGVVPDQYYGVTSRLSANGYQQAAMHVIAGCILLLGLPAAMAATSSKSSNWSNGTVAFVMIGLGCIGMASPWLRYRWPSRQVSIAVVVVGSVILAVGCLLPADPLAGLLVGAAFPFILGYAVLFHGTRLQSFAGVVAGATILVLGIRVGVANIATALAVTTPLVLVTGAVAVGCRIIAELTADSVARTDIEPLTGLLTREGFDEMVATRLGARNRIGDRYLVIVVATLDTFAPMQSLQGNRATDRARVAVGQALRETVRRDALLAHVGEAEFLVADIFSIPDPTPLAERIRSAVAATPHGVTASIGVVCTPLGPLAGRPPKEVIDEAIALATAAMHRARSRGGNQADYVIHESDR